MTFDLPQRLLGLGARRLAVLEIGLISAVFATTAGCWEEIRYEPSQASTRVERDREPTPEDPKAAEPEVDPPSVPDGSVTPASDPLAGTLFGDEETPEDSDPPADVEPTDAEPAPAEEILGTQPTTDSSLDPLPTDGPAEVETDLPPADAEVAVAPVTAQERLDAWKAASAWSLAAAVAAKGLPADRYEPFLADAEKAAEAAGISLPALPALEEAEDAEREARAAEALRTGAGADLVTSITERLDASAGASARLAIDSHLLLLTFSPDGAEDAAAALAISAEAAELPGRLWQPLVDLLMDEADFAAVRGAVFALQKAVAGNYDEAARSGISPPGP